MCVCVCVCVYDDRNLLAERQIKETGQDIVDVVIELEHGARDLLVALRRAGEHLM